MVFQLLIDNDRIWNSYCCLNSVQFDIFFLWLLSPNAIELHTCNFCLHSTILVLYLAKVVFIISFLYGIITLNILYRIDKNDKKQPGFWRRYLWFVGLYINLIFVMFCYVSFVLVMSSIPQKYQWILALISPLMRQIFLWVIEKLASKASGEALPHKLVIRDCINTWHAIIISVLLGGIASIESAYCIITMDFLINIFNACRIIKKNKSGTDGKYFCYIENTIFLSLILFSSD